MELAYLMLVALAATFIATLTGFGFALALIPALVVVVDAKSAVVLTFLLFLFVGSLVSWSARRDLDRPLLMTLLISSLVGLPLGAYVLVVISESLLRMLIGAVIVGASLLLLFNYQRPFGNERWAAVVVGFLGGVMNTSVVISGPFVVLFLANQKMEKHKLRATIAVFLLGVTPISLLLLYLGGLVTEQLVHTTLMMVPASLVGYLLGVRFLPRVNAELLRRITIILVLFAGASIFVGEVQRLLG